MRRPRPYPPCRRRRSRVRASGSIGTPAGMPSRIATSACPCDSPAVRNRSIRRPFYTNFLRPPARAAPHRWTRADRAREPAQPRKTSVLRAVGSTLARAVRGSAVPLQPRVHGPLHELSRRSPIASCRSRTRCTSTSRRVIARGCASHLRLRGAEAVRWAERCAALTTLWHPGMAECLDFGLLGHDDAVRGLPGERAAAAASGTCHSTRGMPAAASRSSSSPVVSRQAPSRSRVRIRPAAGSWCQAPVTGVGGAGGLGAERSRCASLEAEPARARAPCTPARPPDGIDRRAPRASARLRGAARTLWMRSPRPASASRMSTLRPAPADGRCCGIARAKRAGSGGSRWPHRRSAGSRSSAIADGAAVWDAIVAGRHVVVLHDGRRSPPAADRELAAIVLRLGTRVPRPHRVIQLVLRPRAADALTLAPLTPAELSGMLVIAPDARRAARADRSRGCLERRLARAIRRGRPGAVCTTPARGRCRHTRVRRARHASALRHDGWPSASIAPGGVSLHVSRLSCDRAAPRCGAPSARASGWPAPGVTRPLNGCCALPPVRRCGGAVSAEAGDAALACGRLHVDRGRTAAALASFSEALSRYERAGTRRADGDRVHVAGPCAPRRAAGGRERVVPACRLSPPAASAGIGPRAHGRASRWHARCGGLGGNDEAHAHPARPRRHRDADADDYRAVPAAAARRACARDARRAGRMCAGRAGAGRRTGDGGPGACRCDRHARVGVPGGAGTRALVRRSRRCGRSRRQRGRRAASRARGTPAARRVAVPGRCAARRAPVPVRTRRRRRISVPSGARWAGHCPHCWRRRCAWRSPRAPGPPRSRPRVRGIARAASGGWARHVPPPAASSRDQLEERHD